MKRFCLFLQVLTTCFGGEYNFVSLAENPKQEKPIVVIIPSYNNKEYYKKNLDSIFSQKYTNFRVIYTNDASTDDTGKLVQEYVENSCFEGQFDYIENEENQAPLYNIYQMMHSCYDNEIIVTVDGDDWLLHDEVLKKVNQIYSDDRVWMSYGSYIGRGGKKGFSMPMKISIIRDGRHRELSWRWSHLRTCYAGLFKSVPEERWKRAGRFYQSAGDVAIMIYLMDRAREHVFYNPEPLYYYNMYNPLNEFKKKLQNARDNKSFILSQQPLQRLYDKEEFINDYKETK